MLKNIGGPEVLIILVIVMLLFGAKKLPELARSIGTSAREFKKGIEEGVDENADTTEDTTV
ncbi:MAG: twin-arginine translocase TatA/TatE family subunit [Acidimicrobiia bacterium]|nr:twin-arginine translocase TatA/TatE family subunit [Acidimicrobiia bacterium]